uniref:CSON008065 protein n=1 Tax=Culicoides sonorensis TaxID=179676 RepID=A0A336M2D2_CULSO
MSKFNLYNCKTKIWSAPQKASIFNPNASLGDILLHGLENTSDKLSEIYTKNNVTLKSKDVLEYSIRVAENLKKLNLKPGDVVTFSCRNISNLTSLFCGCIFARLVVNPVNPDNETQKFKEIIQKTRPKLIFCQNFNKPYIKEALEELCHISNIINLDNELSIQPLFQSISLDINTHSYTSAVIENTEITPALILTTAGSTGITKCVSLSHAMVISQMIRSIAINQDDTLILSHSIHLFSMICNLVSGVAVGAVRIISELTFNAEIYLKLIEKYRVTKLFISPTHLSSIADTRDFKSSDLSAIKLIQTGGDALMKTLKENVENQLLNGKVVQSYGLLEIGGTATINYPISKEYSVGRPVNQNQFKIIDDTGNKLGPDEEGEICIKPVYYFIGYSSDEQLNKETIDSDGWIHTGDIGYFDNDNFLFIVGRTKDVIQYKGFEI